MLIAPAMCPAAYSWGVRTSMTDRESSSATAWAAGTTRIPSGLEPGVGVD
jgi:hypothetical protein